MDSILHTMDSILWDAIGRRDAEAVQQALQNGADAILPRVFRGRRHMDCTPLYMACQHGFDDIAGVLLDAGADARLRHCGGFSAISEACNGGHLSTVQLLINHDNGLLEFVDDDGWTPLLIAIRRQHSDIVRFLLNRGADARCVKKRGNTALIIACRLDNIEIVRLLLAARVDVEARDRRQQTAMHWAARRSNVELVRELILQHNASMFAADTYGRTPFDLACRLERSADVVDRLLEIYGNKLTQDHGRLALHELLKVAEYSFAEDEEFHPPLNPLRIILPLGKLRLMHLRTLLHNLDPELFRNRDDTGKLPIHLACRTNSPVEVLALILELDTAVLHFTDYTGALPIHLLCGTPVAAEYASVRYLVEQGGVGTLAARNHQGALPLHNNLCGSITTTNNNPSWRTVQYLIQSFPASVAMRNKAGEYPFMLAAAAAATSDSALTPLMISVVYELVRANPGLFLLAASDE